MQKNKKSNKSNIFLIVLCVIVILFVFLLPYLYDFITDLRMPKTGKSEEEIVEKEKVVDLEVLNDIHFPKMRNSKYNANSYYSLDTFKVSDMTNADILLNAFLDIEQVNINNNTFKSKYMELRIKNILGKNVNYNFERFYVPQDANTNYKGYWNYDAGRGLFVYQGGNINENKGIEYYDLTSLKSAEYDNKDIIVEYYILFAKVQGNNYTIYSNPSMTNMVTEGTLDSVSLDEVFDSLDNGTKKVYRFIFKKTLCSYSEYCLYEGAWVDD